jgi:hypothetical protein
MAAEQYANAPDEIVLRECKVAHQVLVTTLLDHRRASKDDLRQLYARRWNVELDLPGRIEPRMRKRRPKPYPWLKTPRPHARRQVQRHGHAWATK